MKRLRAFASARASPVREELVDGFGGEAATEHGVVDALARGRRDDTSGIAGEYHVAAIVPALERLKRDRRAFAADGLRPARPVSVPQFARRRF